MRGEIGKETHKKRHFFILRWSRVPSSTLKRGASVESILDKIPYNTDMVSFIKIIWYLVRLGWIHIWPDAGYLADLKCWISGRIPRYPHSKKKILIIW